MKALQHSILVTATDFCVSLVILIIEKEHMHANIRILLFTYLFPTYALPNKNTNG